MLLLTASVNTNPKGIDTTIAIRNKRIVACAPSNMGFSIEIKYSKDMEKIPPNKQNRTPLGTLFCPIFIQSFYYFGSFRIVLLLFNPQPEYTSLSAGECRASSSLCSCGVSSFSLFPQESSCIQAAQYFNHVY